MYIYIYNKIMGTKIGHFYFNCFELSGESLDLVLSHLEEDL